MVKQSNKLMSEFFIELFSEEIPADLQRNSRSDLLKSFQKFFEEKQILFKKNSSFSTPNRLIILSMPIQIIYLRCLICLNLKQNH